MPLPITKYTDYQKGVYKLPFTKKTVDDLTDYIDRYERVYLEDLLGCDLAMLFIEDLDDSGIPISDRFIYIFNYFCNDSDCNFNRSLGIKDMLRGFVFWEYGKTLTTTIDMQGAVDSESENNSLGKQSGTKLISNYNSSVSWYLAIQFYICQNQELYPEFRGKFKEYTSWL